MRSHRCRVEGQDHLPYPTVHASFDLAQNVVGFLNCVDTLLAQIQPAIHQYPQVLFGRVILSPSIPKLALMVEVAMTQV